MSDSACLFLSVGIAVILRAISGGDIDFISYLPLVTLWPVMVFYFFAVGLYYLFLTTLATWILSWLERKMHIPGFGGKVR